MNKEKLSKRNWFIITLFCLNARLYLALISFCFAIISFQVFYPYLLTYVQYVVIPDNGGVENLLKPGVIITALVVAAILLVCRENTPKKV